MKQYYSIVAMILLLGVSQGEELTLDECIEIALNNKEVVLTSAMNTQIAALNKTRSYAGILPQIGIGETWSERRSFSKGLTFDSQSQQIIQASKEVVITNFGFGMNLSQNIYDGGAWWNNISLAKNNLEVTRQMERQTRINVIRNVYQTFYQLLKSQQLLTVSEWNLDLAKQQVDLVTKQFDLGSVKKTDLLKTQVRQGQSRVNFLSRKSELENAKRNLKNAMGILDEDRDFVIIEPEMNNLELLEIDEAEKVMLGRNPSLIAKRGQVRSSELQYKITKGLRLPSLSANLGYYTNADNSENIFNSTDDNWSLSTSIRLSFPLFTGRDVSSRIQQSKINTRIVNEEYSGQVNDLVLQLESILEVLNNYSEIIPINEEVLLSAEEDQRLVQERYSLGAATILELLDAQVSVIQARSSLISLQYDRKIQEANLMALLGTLDE